MRTIGAIRHDHRVCGALNTLLAPWAFVDDYAVLTKSGQLGLVYRVRGVDYECLDHIQRQNVVRRYEATLRLFDERYHLYQYLFKRRIDPLVAAPCSSPVALQAIQRRIQYLNERRGDLYEIDLYVVLLYSGIRSRATRAPEWRRTWRSPLRSIQDWLSASHATHVVEEELDRALADLRHQALAFEVQTADTLRPVKLTKDDAFRFLRRLVNYDSQRIEDTTLKYDSYIDYFMADSTLECHRGHLDLDGYHVKALTMKEPPASTYPHLLEALYSVPGEFVACLEWQRIPNDRMRRQIHSMRRHHFNRRTSLRNYIASDVKPEEMLVDESAGATVRQLGEALTELEVRGHFFGECSLTVVLYDRDPQALDRATAEAIKTMAAHDGVLVEESYNLLNSWLSLVPGNGAHNLRRLAVMETNCADLSFLFTLDQGTPRCPHLKRDALTIFETEHRTLYHFALHVNDVGNAAILGATGSGKSFLMNCILTQAQRYNPITVIFDIGRSYRKLARLLGGSYLEIGLRSDDATINPFALPPTLEHLHFLSGFLRVLLEGRDGYRLSDTEERECYEAIQQLYVLAPAQRRMYTLAALLPHALSQRLGKWIEGGRYGALFDHVEDTLTVQPFQVFEFEAMRAFPDLLEPLLFYVLHRVMDRMLDPALAGVVKICLMDEAAEFIRHEQFQRYVKTLLRTGRKHHVAMLLAAQSIGSFEVADLLETLRDNCPTKLLLPNPGLDPLKYTQTFQLNDVEVDRLRNLTPRRQFLLKRPNLAKVLNVTVDPYSYAIYTNTPVENDQINALINQLGWREGLERFAASA